jgi:hypothetical protein
MLKYFIIADVQNNMAILEWINTYSGALTFFATLILVIITAVYVKYTQKIMESTKKQFISQQNPVIGIKTGEMYLVELDDGYREFNAEFHLTNLGNAPALEVIIESEIKLNISNIKGENSIPSRWASVVSYIRVGEELDVEPNCVQSFDSNVFKHMIQGFKKERELNNKRIKKNFEPEYSSSILSIDVYCKNSFNQYFKSHFETHLIQGEKFPDYIEVKPFFSPNQKFYSNPISEDEFKKETTIRKLKREKLPK